MIIDGKPEVLPVNYGLDGDSVLFRTAEGTVLTEARHSVVAVEADHVDETSHTGWSVLVQGFAQDITDTIDPTSERLRRLAVVTWAPDPRQRWFRVIPDRITGRRLRVYPDAL
ncbi:MAG: pyridoxamine 5'-phosphate oxidase family protein [Actinomycetota bacterium]|nr:pyridoxamine 5'-phosphate oxidase family protein [Actinomycetota bacterium]